MYVCDYLRVLALIRFNRPSHVKANPSADTDHSAANTQFVMGGAVKGGIKGTHPSLTQLGGDGNLMHTADYRSLYASLLRDWWGFSSAQSEKVLGGKYGSIPLFA